MVWWAVLVQSLVGVATITGAYIVGSRSVKAGQENAHLSAAVASRAEWGRRFESALALARSENTTDAALGFTYLERLIGSDLATDEEVALAKAMARRFLQPLDPGRDEADDGRRQLGGPEPEGGGA